MPGLVAAKKRKTVEYTRWGYFFIAPFFVIYTIFSLIPLISTFYNSFFENYRVGLTQVGPNLVGIQAFISVFTESKIYDYAWNTVLLWLLNFIPQIACRCCLPCSSLARACALGQQLFKTVIYMPNLIMASAFAMLFFALFSDGGPVNDRHERRADERAHSLPLLCQMDPGAHICIMNFMMWFGNTTILLMSGIWASTSLCSRRRRSTGPETGTVFFRITMPLLMPIFVFVLITSLIGGLQMFDVPQILTNGSGNPDRTSMTLIMFLNKHLASKNYGMGGAVSVLIFFVTGALSFVAYRTTMRGYRESGAAN